MPILLEKPHGYKNKQRHVIALFVTFRFRHLFLLMCYAATQFGRNLRAYHTCIDHHIKENLDTYMDEISHMIVSHHFTFTQVVDYLREKYGPTKGFSERSLRKYCKINSIHGNPSKSSFVADDILVDAVEKAIEQVRNVIKCHLNYYVQNVVT